MELRKAILTVLVKHSYSGIDDRSKVRHLMAGIKTKVLDPVKAQIMASAALRNNFDAYVNLYKDFIGQSDDLGDTRRKLSVVTRRTDSLRSDSSWKRRQCGLYS